MFMREEAIVFGNKRGWIYIALSLIFLALLVTPMVSAEDVQSDSGTIELNGNQYWVYHMSLPEGGGIKYTIKANDSVNVYLLDDLNYKKYESGLNFEYIEGGSSTNTQYASVQYYVNSSVGGTYHLVVESANSKPVKFTYQLEYGKDVELSIWEFLRGMGGMMCIITAIVLLLWLMVLIWVYKDAKRRGKSGVLWFFIVLIFNILGLIIWLIVRPKNRVR